MAGLELSGIRKAFGGTNILDGVSLDIGASEFIAFLGPSPPANAFALPSLRHDGTTPRAVD